jgi:hypothetical protein
VLLSSTYSGSYSGSTSVSTISKHPILTVKSLVRGHAPMAPRVRHCVECPRCFTRYLVGFSPYPNGSSLRLLAARFSEEWTLCCACGAASRWNWNELKAYVVSCQAYGRGYGSPDEIVPEAGKWRISG